MNCAAAAEKIDPCPRGEKRRREDGNPERQSPLIRGSRENRPDAARDLRQVVAQRREVAREIVRRGIALPRILGQSSARRSTAVVPGPGD